ncbi:MAG: serine/threonine-protein kinase [Myxococcota bacterium]|nr:serine/threonine-protein kinase [Myxococcota bacterium]
MTVRRPSSAEPDTAREKSGLTVIQSQLDERFERETGVLFRARLLTSGLLVALLFVLLAGVDLLSGLTSNSQLSLPTLLLLRMVPAVYLVVLTGLFRAMPRVPWGAVDVLLFIPAAGALMWSLDVTGASFGEHGALSSPYAAAYLVLVAARTTLVPGRRRDHLPVVGALLLLYPVAVVVFGSGLDDPWGWLAKEPRGSLLLVDLVVLFAVAGVGLLGSDMTHAMHERLVSARSVGRYKIKKELGRGAMGVVYLAWHRDLGRPCVIKFVHPDKDESGSLSHRFEREARETSLLRSPYTVQVFDFGVTQKGELFYVMEYLEGESLQSRLVRSGAQPFDLVCRWLSFACESLAEAHARMLIHRDIKPANLFLARTADGRETVKVLDFGIARKEQGDPESVFSAPQEGLLPAGVDLTAVGTVMGTPLYVAPEVLAGEPASDRADQYSLAATGFHLLTGRPVFRGKSIEDLLRRTLRDTAPSPSALQPDASIPAGLDAVLLRGLSKDPKKRYASMEAFRLALEPFAAAPGSDRSVTAGD